MKNKKQTKEQKLAEEKALVEIYKAEIGQHKLCWKCITASMLNNMGAMITLGVAVMLIKNTIQLHELLVKADVVSGFSLLFLLTALFVAMRGITQISYELTAHNKIDLH